MPLRYRQFFWPWGTSFQAYLDLMDSLFRPAAPGLDRLNHSSTVKLPYKVSGADKESLSRICHCLLSEVLISL